MGIKKWGAARATIDRYIQQVRDRWFAESAAERETAMEASIARLLRLSRKLESKKAWGPLVGVEKLLIDVRGLRAPERHEHKVAAMVAQFPASVSIELIDGASDALLDELERLLERHVAGTTPPNAIGDAAPVVIG